ncbi:hypothetical protein B0O99DRAFT_59133 [Bisporella sp. PMI_857]|nr:hypothetical protein B0O99DRAFT_59133 [Bisporella sp. PMI_857]
MPLHGRSSRFTILIYSGRLYSSYETINMAPDSPIGPPDRRTTTASGRVLSFKKQSTIQPYEAKHPEMVKQQVSAYDLDWKPLKAFLLRRFPKMQDEDFVEDVNINLFRLCCSRRYFERALMIEQKQNDNYHLRLPENLTEIDRDNIRQLKKSHTTVQPPRPVTPD